MAELAWPHPDWTPPLNSTRPGAWRSRPSLWNCCVQNSSRSVRTKLTNSFPSSLASPLAGAFGLVPWAGGTWLWARLLVDEYGAYVRFWPDGSAEPVTTAPLISHWGLGGRGERWHAYEETGVPKVLPLQWNRLWITAGSSTTLFELDSVQMVDQPCP